MSWALARMLVAAVAVVGCLVEGLRSACLGGFQCTAAGAVTAEGCYAPAGDGDYVLNPRYALYTEGGVWRIGHKGVGVSYVAKAPSATPPLAAEDWQCGDGTAPGYPHGIHGAPSTASARITCAARFRPVPRAGDRG